MPHAHAHPLDHAIHTATEWVDAVAAQFGTGDHQFVHRIIRAWLHGVRDRLAVVEAVHLGAQLPELLRGIYYEGWDPLAVPVRVDVVTGSVMEVAVALTVGGVITTTAAFTVTST